MRMIFPATHTPIYLVVRGDSKKSDAFIEANQDAALPDVKGGYTVCFFELNPSSEPVIAAPVAKSTPEDLRKLEDIEEMKFSGKKVFVWFMVPTKALDAVQKMKNYMHKIVNHVRDAFQTAGDQGEFWFAEQNPIPKDAVTARRPKMPWLFDENGNYTTLDTPDPFFLDDRDRRSKLVEASIIERHHMVNMYDVLFRPGKEHEATLELAAVSQWKIHIWMNSPDQKPAPPEGNRAKYKIQGLGEGDGLCIASSLADFAILTSAPFTSDWNGKTCKIELALKLNLKSILGQILEEKQKWEETLNIIQEVRGFMADVVKFHRQSVVDDSRTQSRGKEWLKSLGRKARRSAEP
ncbi:uncharacterized protein N7483_012520 [Penicillium malachiteum]|uniref:uncharacterized protein n=1 Tax=Penicillium malachiteum TaxID=1324776 RepID=UPI002547D836|nr:uncharacterized protein N7483_012520 [Penicillium malachiteum]KAJ5715339.1 hypothetical protein N7483_012520 [Penicillium malachiteum]